MQSLIIKEVERTWVEVPLKTRHDRHLTRENWDWTVFEILRLRTNSELVGYGETMIYYTWSKVPQEQIQRVIGHSPFEFLWDDKLGAGLQMAVWDLAGKAAGLPCYKLMGAPVREWCPVSWWTNDMSDEDWLDEMREALSLGYMSAKLKARPWRDFAAQVRAMSKIMPSDCRFDADFNGFLLNAG
ncbi:MAG: enolase, partial [Chloroflexota bacterium]